MLPETTHSIVKTKRKLVIITIISGVFLVLVILAYVGWFSYNEVPVSKNSEEWGQFGDYIGGLLNPAFSFLAFIGLLWSIYQNQINLERTSEAFKKSMELSISQENREVKQDRKEDILKVVNIIESRITKILEMEVKRLVGVYSRNRMRLDTIGDLFNYYLDDYKQEDKDEIKEDLGYYLTILNNNLAILAKFLKEYEVLSGNSAVADYYKHYYIFIANTLKALNAIDADAHEFYSSRDLQFFSKEYLF